MAMHDSFIIGENNLGIEKPFFSNYETKDLDNTLAQIEISPEGRLKLLDKGSNYIQGCAPNIDAIEKGEFTSPGFEVIARVDENRFLEYEIMVRNNLIVRVVKLEETEEVFDREASVVYIDPGYTRVDPNTLPPPEGYELVLENHSLRWERKPGHETPKLEGRYYEEGITSLLLENLDKQGE